MAESQNDVATPRKPRRSLDLAHAAEDSIQEALGESVEEGRKGRHRHSLLDYLVPSIPPVDEDMPVRVAFSDAEESSSSDPELSAGDAEKSSAPNSAVSDASAQVDKQKKQRHSAQRKKRSTISSGMEAATVDGSPQRRTSQSQSSVGAHQKSGSKSRAVSKSSGEPIAGKKYTDFQSDEITFLEEKMSAYDFLLQGVCGVKATGESFVGQTTIKCHVHGAMKVLQKLRPYYCILVKDADLRTEDEIGELYNLFLSNKFFAGLPKKVCKDLCSKLRTEEFGEDEVVIRKGDMGDTFYIVLFGAVSIWSGKALEDDQGNVDYGLHFCNRATGDAFGELALIKKQPRAATVITEMPTTFVTVNMHDYNTTLKNVHEYTAKTKLNFCCRLPVLHGLSILMLEQVVQALTEVEFKEGQDLITEGAHGSSIFFINAGVVQVFKDVQSDVSGQPRKGKVLLGKLGQHDFIGDHAILSGEDHIISATAASDVSCYALSQLDLQTKLPASFHKQIPSYSATFYLAAGPLTRSLLEKRTWLHYKESVLQDQLPAVFGSPPVKPAGDLPPKLQHLTDRTFSTTPLAERGLAPIKSSPSFDYQYLPSGSPSWRKSAAKNHACDPVRSISADLQREHLTASPSPSEPLQISMSTPNLDSHYSPEPKPNTSASKLLYRTRVQKGYLDAEQKKISGTKKPLKLLEALQCNLSSITSQSTEIKVLETLVPQMNQAQQQHVNSLSKTKGKLDDIGTGGCVLDGLLDELQSKLAYVEYCPTCVLAMVKLTVHSNEGTVLIDAQSLMEIFSQFDSICFNRQIRGVVWHSDTYLLLISNTQRHKNINTACQTMATALMEMQAVLDSSRSDSSIGYGRWPSCALHGGFTFGPLFITSNHMGPFLRQLTGPAFEDTVRMCRLAQLNCSLSNRSEVRCSTAAANEVYLEIECKPVSRRKDSEPERGHQARPSPALHGPPPPL
ncbi:hypothetical protein CYMTET_30642 [Cymbomonas tetramitiformis]|uniref:Cyclic nucleotide-binding domain-containing protein n=1 Tax=Cymbomonas tetramitiformis TaxID=36881 RepID=A0AAE0FIR1_9CHLO|nr:hypothetical protein CYMTET_30642 [Cymbomonas tetramitiformis]